MRKFQQIGTQSRELELVQTSIAKTFGSIEDNELLSGFLLERVILGAGENTITHRLGRRLLGWFVTRLRGNVAVWDAQDLNPISDKTLILHASAPVTVDLFLF